MTYNGFFKLPESDSVTFLLAETTYSTELMFALSGGILGINISDKSLIHLELHISKEDWREWIEKVQN